MKLVEAIIPYNMTHNAESEACDLAMETDRIDLLEAHVDEKAYARVRPPSVFRDCWPFLTLRGPGLPVPSELCAIRGRAYRHSSQAVLPQHFPQIRSVASSDANGPEAQRSRDYHGGVSRSEGQVCSPTACFHVGAATGGFGPGYFARRPRTVR